MVVAFNLLVVADFMILVGRQEIFYEIYAVMVYDAFVKYSKQTDSLAVFR